MGDVRADRFDHARALHAQPRRQGRHRIQARAVIRVDVVESRRVDLHDEVLGARCRVCKVDPLEDLGAADRRKMDEYLTAVRELELRIARAREILNWEPKVDLDDGLERTMLWYRRQLEVAA